MIDKIDVTEELLQKYVDGKLDDVQIHKVENYLERNPDELERINIYKEQNDLLAALYHHADDELLHKVDKRTKESKGIKIKYKILLPYVSSFSWVVLGVLIGINLNVVKTKSNLVQYNFPQRAIVSHRVFTPEILHPVEVKAKHEKHLTAWLSKRLERKLIIPNLNLLGYSLVGGRLLAAKNGPAAQFMFENDSGDRLTFYVAVTNSSDTAFKFAEKNNTKVFSWNDESMGFAVVGNVQKKFLLKAASVIYKDYVL